MSALGWKAYDADRAARRRRDPWAAERLGQRLASIVWLVIIAIVAAHLAAWLIG